MKLRNPFNRTCTSRRSTIDCIESSSKRALSTYEDYKPLPKPPQHNDSNTRLSLQPTDRILTSEAHSSTLPKRLSLAFDGFSPQDSLQVLVIGDGFASLSAAIGCCRQGYDVTCFDRSEGASSSNQEDVTMLGANATLLLTRWGCVDEIWRHASPGKWLEFKDAQGRTLYKEDLDEISAQYGAPLLSGTRSQMLESLRVHARLCGVQFDHNAEIVGFEDSRNRPGAILASREIRRADIIIVCNGVNSTAKSLLFSDDQLPQLRRPSNFSVYQAIMDSENVTRDPQCSYLLDGNIRTWLGEDAHISIYPVDSGRQIAFTYTHKDAYGSSSHDWRSLLPVSTMLDTLQGWDKGLQTALSKFKHVSHWQIMEGEVQSEWVSRGGKICVAGDSVHPTLPASMQSGSQSVEDGATIAQCLAMAGGEKEGVGLALKVYERLRKPRVELASRLGRKQMKVLHSFVSHSQNLPFRNSQRFSWYESSTVPSSDSGNGGSPARLSAFAVNPNVLRPLSFEMFSFDCEQHVLDSWVEAVRDIGQARRTTSHGLSEEMAASARRWAQMSKIGNDHASSPTTFAIDSFAALGL